MAQQLSPKGRSQLDFPRLLGASLLVERVEGARVSCIIDDLQFAWQIGVRVAEREGRTALAHGTISFLLQLYRQNKNSIVCVVPN